MLPPKPLSYAWHFVDGKYIKIFGDTVEERKRVLGYLEGDRWTWEDFGGAKEVWKFYPDEEEDKVMFSNENMEKVLRFIRFFLK